jgi:hypothetical protein
VCHVQWLNSYRQQGEGRRHCCVCSSTAPADSCLAGHIAGVWIKFLYTFPVLPIRAKMSVPSRPHPLTLSPYNIWQNVRIIKTLIRKSSRLLLLPVMSRHFLAFESCSGTRLWLLQVPVFFGRPCRWIQRCYLKVRPRPFPCISITVHCSLILSWGAIPSELLTASLKQFPSAMFWMTVNLVVFPQEVKCSQLCAGYESQPEVSSVVLFQWSANSFDHVPLHH